jgi:hypothetical protein
VRRLPLLALALLSLAPLACSSGSGGDSGPTAPTPTAMIQGTWAGTGSSVSASGTCLANDFHPIPVAVRWQFVQNGTTFTGTETVNNAQVCTYHGTISGNTVTFLVDANNVASYCTTQTTFCSPTPGRLLRLDLQTAMPVLTTTVAGTQMSGSGTTTWNVTDLTSNSSLGTYAVNGTQSLTKQ